ncbi:MAG: MliC family protein [Hyphomonadaceae bacterium]
MKTLLLAAAFLSLAACASSGASGRVDWSCDGGKAFSLRYNASGAAEVFAAGRTYTLPQAQSGSGTRYSDGTVEYREHQGSATLTGAFAGPYENCRR